MRRHAVLGRKPQLGDGLAGHDACGAARKGHAGGLGREGHRTAGARVQLDDQDLLVLDRKLDVEKAVDVHRKRKLAGNVAHALHDGIGEREGRPTARGVAGVDPALLDVLEDRAHVALGAVAEGVNVQLDGILQERVEVDGVVRRDARGLGHVGAKVVVVVDDRHATTAQHVARAHEQRVANATRDLGGVLHGLCRRGGRIGNLQAVEQAREAIAILGQVDGLGLGAHDGDARGLEPAGKVDGGLATQCHDDAHGLLDLDDVHDVLEGERLEVEAVGGVVVGRDGLGVAVDHDRLVALGLERVRGVNAAVVKLDALANAVGAGREDHHAGLLCLRALGGATVLVGEVVVTRASSKLAGAGVDGLHERAHAHDLAHGTHDLLARPREVGNLTVREAKLLGCEHVVVVEANEPQLRDRALGGDDVRDAVKEPAVDMRELEDALHAPAAT